MAFIACAGGEELQQMRIGKMPMKLGIGALRFVDDGKLGHLYLSPRHREPSITVDPITHNIYVHTDRFTLVEDVAPAPEKTKKRAREEEDGGELPKPKKPRRVLTEEEKAARRAAAAAKKAAVENKVA
jgi:hypothetical protein